MHEIIYCNIYVMVSYIIAYAVILQEKYVIYVMLLYIKSYTVIIQENICCYYLCDGFIHSSICCHTAIKHENICC